MRPVEPDFESFHRLAAGCNAVPVFSRLSSITMQPLEAVHRLGIESPTFLLESLGPYGEFSRASFMGLNPIASAVARPGEVEIKDHITGETETHSCDPWQGLELLMSRFRVAQPEVLEDFFYGGVVGFMGYDAVRSLERLPVICPVDPDMREMHFVVCQDLLRFDRSTEEVQIFSLGLIPDKAVGEEELETAYQTAVSRVEDIGRKLLEPGKVDGKSSSGDFIGGLNWESNVSRSEYEGWVRKAKEYIRNGDIIQVVLSQRLSSDFEGDPLSLYQVLREVNPSPYSFYLDLDGYYLVGASPEMLVRLTGDRIQVRPIAGTRPRGEDKLQDEALAEELANDPKEKAEHIMLVDLGRNDVGRVAKIGTVIVPKLMTVELYSHVMHLVTHVEGVLNPGFKPIDVLKASFPAGTLSGAPKIRAMEIIEEMEPVRRGPYGGAVGYLSFSNDMDFCITIRTLVIEDGRTWVQAGAGIVADSVPETEFEETLHKAQAVLAALKRGRQE